MPRKPVQNTIELRKPAALHQDKWGDNFALKNRGNVGWADCNKDLLHAALAAATEDGAALLLSRTSDGGALSIHVLTSVTTHKLYPATVEEINEALQLIVKIAS
jgi:hypothetical protein